MRFRMRREGQSELERRLERGLLRPLDLLRRRGTHGLAVAVTEGEVHRGDEVEALLTISRTGGLGHLEVGLVCTEHYAAEITTGEDDPPTRGTSTATAYETWAPVENVLGEQIVRLMLPADAPFSYEGTALSFTWQVVARGRKSHRLDAQASSVLWVLP